MLPSLIMHRTNVRLPSHNVYSAPVAYMRARRPNTSTVAVLYFLLLSSFLPYLQPPEDRPLLYRDGMSVDEIKRRHEDWVERRHQHELNRYIGGDIQRIDWGVVNN